ncbi:LOW QUALITY PROTEIN: uncharacterized protein gas2l1 [Synchiropus picturatus]
MADQSNIQSAASKSIRPFRSSEEYLDAMKEDLAEWLNTLYELDVTTETFMDGLETGTALCRHANHVNRAAQDFLLEYPEAARAMKLPSRDVLFQSRNVSPGSFVARDNVSNFISWCRQELWIKDVLMFETNDLVERCNEKNFVLCLLEVARRGSKFGMLAPMLIQLEEEIEEEIRDQGSLQLDAREPQKRSPPSGGFGREESRAGVEQEPEPEPQVWPQKRVLCDMRNLDELVREILGRCSCPAQFPMIKVSEGKYKVGDSSALIFIRVLRTHVMVRVGGGWDTLEHYLDKHDPCRCAAFAHRYHQAKASGQGGQSKSSSAHSSRSTSPGPHWSRNDGTAPYKPACSGPSNPSSTSRLARSQYPSVPTDLDSSAARALLPRPPRDRSEPRHFNPLRNRETMLPVTRRLSGDSDSSTASSKGGGGGAGRRSLGAASHRSSDEIVLLVNRKEGRHMIERPAAGQGPSLARTRSQSRERTSHSTGLKPTPPRASSNGSQAPRTERGRSLVSDGARKFHVPRSHSQGKLQSRTWSRDSSPASTSSSRDARPPPPERKEERGPKQGLCSSTKPGGGLAKRQSSSCSNSPIKGLRNNSPNKKVLNTPRAPAPRLPSVAKGRLLPPVTSGGRRSPHSSPRNSQHHAVRGTRSLTASRSNGHTHHRSTQGPEPPEPGGEGSGAYHMLPAIDPQREQDLYRSFEAEFLANTQQARQTSGRECVGKTPAGAGTHVAPAASDPNVTDSAYSSSNSSTSSKKGALPDLRESKRNNPHFLPLEDPLNLLYNFAEPQHFSQVEGEHWRKLPAIHSSREERDCHGNAEASATTHLPQTDGCCRNMNGDHPSAGGWGSEPVQLRQPNLPYDSDHSDASDDLPPPEACPSPIPLPPSEDCSFQDSSSEHSSMCLSLSESHSESPPLTSPLANGVAQAKGQTRPDRVTPTSKHRVTPGIRPRADKRPEIRPSRIPTPVSYRELQSPGRLSPCHTPPPSPQSSRAAARSAMGRNMQQAFADMVHPQSRSAAMDN